jgi:transcriptional regulator with XRE-family HTH domain
MITDDDSDEAVLKEIGRRIAQYRLNQNKTQVLLAQEAGVSHRTQVRIERGQSVQATSLIRVLRALQLLENLEALIPAPAISPIQQVKMQGKQRQRASTKSRQQRQNQERIWSWGDDE